MTEILWGPYQEHHITDRHGVTAQQFEVAWIDRVDLLVRSDDPSRVFPITAYFLPREETH